MTSSVDCEICSNSIPEGDVQSTSNHEAVCETCFNDMWECADCCEQQVEDEASYEVRHGNICEDCCSSGNYGNCYSCEELISLNNDNYYIDDNFGNNHCCDGCADESLYDCTRCGNFVSWREGAGSDWAYDELCQRCWEGGESHISRNIMRGSANLSIDSMALKDSYKAATAETQDFFNWFYGRSMTGTYEHNMFQIKKGAKFLDSEQDWFEINTEIKSEVYIHTAQVIYEMISSDVFLTEHKKYKLYHPLRHLFRRAMKYYDLAERQYVEGADLTMEKMGSDYFNFRIERADTNLIADMLSENKTDDGADLKRALNQIMQRAYKYRFPQLCKTSKPNWETTFQQYKTNAENIELTISIGFDDESQQTVAEWNAGVSCQERCNRDNYAFGLMDMAVNPHLYALLRNGLGEIIGRSVIRIFKADWSDEEAPVYVAPSRLYMSQLSNAKKDAYIALFMGAKKWASHVFENHKLIAYRSSRHDSPIYTYLRECSKLRIRNASSGAPRLFTQSWMPWWHSKPENGEAAYTYYQDEEQQVEYRSVRGGSESNEKYAVFESIYSDGYKIIEVTND